MLHSRKHPAAHRQRLSIWWGLLFVSVVVPALLLVTGCPGSGGSSRVGRARGISSPSLMA
ncbi:MAG: hypothetical protein P8124_08585 [Gammaproteobacteria bacterium]